MFDEFAVRVRICLLLIQSVLCYVLLLFIQFLAPSGRLSKVLLKLIEFGGFLRFSLLVNLLLQTLFKVIVSRVVEHHSFG